MATKQKQGYCPQCEKNTLGQKEVLGDGMGCLLTILTGGLFLLLWLPIRWFMEPSKPFICQVCGSKLKKAR